MDEFPECQVCGSKDYDCLDGLYYCMECQTQSQVQQSVEMVTDAFDEDGGAVQSQFTAIGRSTKPPRKDKNKDKSDINESPHLKYEIYTLTIRRQARALTTNLGFDPFVEDGAAIDPSTPDDQIVNGASHMPDEQERNRSTSFNSRKSSLIGSVGTSSPEPPSISDTVIENAEWFTQSDNEFFDCMSAISVLSSIGSVASSQTKSSGSGGSNRKVSYSRDYSVFRPLFTLILIYLACISCNVNISFSDIFRWIEAQLIPFPDHTSLPVEYGSADTFNVKNMAAYHRKAVYASSNGAFFSALLMHRFLELPDFQSTSLMVVVARYVRDFNLPREFIHRVNIVFKLCPVSDKFFMGSSDDGKGSLWSHEHLFVITPDSRALALIIVTLKLIFGLDSVREIMISKMAQDNENAFVLTEWVLQCRMRMAAYRGKSPRSVLSGHFVDDHVTTRNGIIDQLVPTKFEYLRSSSKETLEAFAPMFNKASTSALQANSFYPVRDTAQYIIDMYKNEPNMFDAVSEDDFKHFSTDWFNEGHVNFEFFDRRKLGTLLSIVPEDSSSSDESSVHSVPGNSSKGGSRKVSVELKLKKVIPNTYDVVTLFPCADGYVVYPTMNAKLIYGGKKNIHEFLASYSSTYQWLLEMMSELAVEQIPSLICAIQVIELYALGIQLPRSSVLRRTL